MKNGHDHAPFHAKYFYIRDRALLDELRARHMKQDKEKFLTFALFVDTMIQQNKIFCHKIMYLFMKSVRPFENDRTERSMKWETNAEM